MEGDVPDDPNVLRFKDRIEVKVCLHQDLQRVSHLLGVGEVLGPRLEIPEGLQSLKESLSEECLRFFMLGGHVFYEGLG